MNLEGIFMLDENKYAEDPLPHPMEERFANPITAYGGGADKREPEYASGTRIFESAFRSAMYGEYQRVNARMGIMPADILFYIEREIAALKNQAFGHEKEIAALKKLVDSLQELADIRNNPRQRNNRSTKTLEAVFGTEPDDTIDTKKLDGLLSDYVDEKHDSLDLVRAIRGR